MLTGRRFHVDRQADREKDLFLKQQGYMVQRYTSTERALDQVRSFMRCYLL
jgi:very-short-patch-repair endonuclease